MSYHIFNAFDNSNIGIVISDVPGAQIIIINDDGDYLFKEIFEIEFSPDYVKFIEINNTQGTLLLAKLGEESKYIVNFLNHKVIN